MARLAAEVRGTKRRFLSVCHGLLDQRLTLMRRWAAERGFVAAGGGAAAVIIRRPLLFGGAGSSRTFLHCWTEAVPEGAVLCAEGEIDVATAPLFANAVAAALRKDPRVIVDLSRLRYLDGTGVRVLENAARSNGGRLVVVGSSPSIHRVLDILELNKVLPVVGTLDVARAYFREQ